MICGLIAVVTDCVERRDLRILLLVLDQVPRRHQGQPLLRVPFPRHSQVVETRLAIVHFLNHHGRDSLGESGSPTIWPYSKFLKNWRLHFRCKRLGLCRGVNPSQGFPDHGEIQSSGLCNPLCRFIGVRSDLLLVCLDFTFIFRHQYFFLVRVRRK